MEISNLYSTSTILVEYERTTKKVPTMKSLDSDNKKSAEKAPEVKEEVKERKLKSISGNPIREKLKSMLGQY